MPFSISQLLIGGFGIGLGFYALAGLAFPKLRPRNWRDQPTIQFVCMAFFCILLGLWAFRVWRPYTWIAAMVIWIIGFLIDRSRHGEARLHWRAVLLRREVVALLAVIISLLAVWLWIVLK